MYAAARDLDVTPLPWSRTYLALSADSGMALGATVDADAVRADARPAAPLACGATPGVRVTETTQTRSGRVLYAIGDRTARELGERLVAVTGRADATAVGVGADELTAELRAGDALSYIISVRRESLCETLSTLTEGVGWLSPHSIRALVDTRAHAIAPRPIRP